MLPSQKLSLFGRYDYWDADQPDATTFRVSSGVAFHFSKYSKFVISADYFDDTKDVEEPLTTLFKIDLEVRF